MYVNHYPIILKRHELTEEYRKYKDHNEEEKTTKVQ